MNVSISPTQNITQLSWGRGAKLVKSKVNWTSQVTKAFPPSYTEFDKGRKPLTG
jgi:hypothetical protein